MKVFTYASDSMTDTAIHTGLHRRYRSREIIGLLFGSTTGEEVPSEDIEKIVSDPVLVDVFGPLFNAVRVEGGNNSDHVNLFVSPSEDWLPYPDKTALSDDPLWFRDASGLVQLHPRKILADCLQLTKALGCRDCPLNGTECYRLHGMPNKQEPDTKTLRPDEDDMKEQFQHLKSKIAGYTFVSPMMTKIDGAKAVSFWPALRGVDFHEFSDYNVWWTQRSDNALKVHTWKRFKKGECSRCPVLKGCDRWRHCDGRYPTEKEIIAANLAKLATLMKNTDTLEPWQVWVLARAAGTRGYIGNLQVMLGGVEIPWRYSWQSNSETTGFKSMVWRSRDARKISRKFSYYQLAEIFGLPLGPRPESWWHKRYGRPTHLALALFTEALQTDAYIENSCYSRWGGSKQRTVVARNLGDTSVSILFAGNRNIWNRDVFTMKDFADWHLRFGDLRTVKHLQTRNDYAKKV